MKYLRCLDFQTADGSLKLVLIRKLIALMTTLHTCVCARTHFLMEMIADLLMSHGELIWMYSSFKPPN